MFASVLRGQYANEIVIVPNHMKDFCQVCQGNHIPNRDELSNFLTLFQSQDNVLTKRNLEVGYRVIHLLLDQGAGHAEMVMGRVQLISFTVKFKLSSC